MQYMKWISGLVCLGALATSLFAQSEEMSFKFEFELYDEKTYATLDDLSASILTDPYVLTAIGLKRSQIAMMPVRSKVSEIMKMIGTTQIAQADESEDRGPLTTEFEKIKNLQAGLKLNDLDSKQKKSLRRIALKDRPLDSLQTSEVGFALNLSPDQLKRLKTIQGEYWSQVRKVESKYAPSNESMLKALKELEVLKDESIPVATKLNKLNAYCQKVENWMGIAYAKAEEPVAKSSKAANERALRVLNPVQAKRYKELQS